jgi:hypothetical protein
MRRPSTSSAADRPAPRSIHLIDADNLLGDPATTDRTLISRTFEAYRAAARVTGGDHVVVATGRNGLHVLEVELAWPGVRHRRRSGPDGADLELLDEVDWLLVARRFDRVVIGSGDGVFASAVQRCVAAGIAVEVLSRPEALSQHLARAAGGHIVLLTAVPDAA